MQNNIKKFDLRKNFWDTMCKLAKNDKDIILITGDLGYSFDKEYIEKYPTQFINAGCAEQNMIGVAAGLARSGKKPFVYSNAIFILARAYEQVRDDIAYQDLNVKLIGTGASGFLGFTHNWGILENENDLLYNLPNIRCAIPQDEGQLRRAMGINGPAFIRI